jgi:elongation factor G
MAQIDFPDPVVSYAVRAVSRNDEEKLSLGMHRLHDEDPTFQTHYNSETHETIDEGLGERHIEVAMSRVARQFGV